jgi:NADH-quinone oxidoreductase subunit A
MEAHYYGYISLVAMIVLCMGMMGAVVVINSFLGPKMREGFHREPFECGSVPATGSRQRYSVNFYLVAIFFIVFDIEAVFMYPWAVLYRSFIADPNFGIIALGEMFVFVGILVVGLLYVLKRGALKFT